MAPHIDRIQPDQGKEGQKWVTLQGDLDGTTKLLWGNKEVSVDDTFVENYGDSTDVDVEVPPGKGTVHVVAVRDDGKSNSVDFTYV
ncbi:IPT/TIG domain-containing protein [Streptomyces huiliensis]|uniref:IPT/TIG domain-containing protein n=1 Tax=Streptomyces huiliensis TaxID=2876027 RepID=UPI001CBB9714|nr:IPT/TIG domain-containing protein [Streptomyces huiliensis]MBZ4322938.1 hypothetical protein [Streptomyces huiliensis]